MIPPLFGKQEVGIWQVKKCLPRYGVPIWSLWPNIRFLPSIVAEKNATKNGYIQKCMFNVYKNQQNRQTGSRNLKPNVAFRCISGVQSKVKIVSWKWCFYLFFRRKINQNSSLYKEIFIYYWKLSHRLLSFVSWLF
jgi:hypothetical protein